ncbi:protein DETOXIFICATION 19-like [Silene latifolia]|uniref:protein DETOXIFICATION 19-like n=1 Tax=Silene latifolia TaxID=37657 RepID=UPI003D76B4E0
MELNKRSNDNPEDVEPLVGQGSPIHMARVWSGTRDMDIEEARGQIMLALPMVLTNVFYYLIPLVSVMFVGHLGELELASSTLANSWATVSGFAFMLGLSGALETLCGQGYGAQLYNMMGIYLQASCAISFLFSILISILWWYTEPILISLDQRPDISKQASTYMRYLIPGIFAYGTLQNILRFLQTQSVVLPLVICSLIPLLLHIILAYLLVHCTSLGYKGAPLATSIAFWIAIGMLMMYMRSAKNLERTWTGFSRKALSYCHVSTNLKLALPSAGMVCLEYWAFEILVFMAGLMPNSETSTSLIAICVNTEAIAYTFTYGLSAAASTRVANELGATRPSKAKHAMGVTLKLSVVLTTSLLLAFGFGHSLWARSFSSEPDIIKAFASMAPFVCVSIFLDSIQGILSGVSRGCGWQHLTMFINLGTFYGIGMPIAWLLAFKFKLYAKGLWIGLICGLSSQCGTLFVVTCLKKWIAVDFSTHEGEPLPTRSSYIGST